MCVYLHFWAFQAWEGRFGPGDCSLAGWGEEEDGVFLPAGDLC